ncbi:CBO0543 family protein [Sporomusa acidovorans]|uniref:Uncharacterized protein n=1 Tax=Sporomusa acidovorans (strain ATCC 49682 / DSM 3132 / Mol) TaxID=1123286 RepID=A0ABZ3J2F0_SPOA4|nr:CBO0543 family protein [Sporomusa acidovorans]OZC23227.1 hypothetical protein SPACI_08770 [Sporomusa acidovorans DSM 3132]SDE98110.1 hypothetical protein SAMN04488499_102863 [Sporomusa acidovorans]
MTENLNQYAEIFAAQKYYHDLQYQHWLQYELFTYQWWLLLATLIVPWIFWWRIVDRSRTGIILAYGIYIMFVVTAMDATGLALKLWIYPIKLLPIIPDSIGIDWGLLTVLDMLIYQYFPKWKTFLIVESIAAVLLAFVGEPFAEWLEAYFVLHWYHTWSFPLYIMKAVIGKWLIEKAVYRVS